MDTESKNSSWGTNTKYENQVFENYDFTDTVFDNVSFKGVTFQNCLFCKSDLSYFHLWSCKFIDCEFSRVDLRNISFGADGGLFKGCRFFRCDFRQQYFWRPVFEDCVFEKCKLKKIDFNDASFLRCRFIGKMEDVTFNGMYHKVKREMKALDYVDFSEAIFGEFVGFEDCDLSTCTPPAGTTFDELLYVSNLNKPKRLSTGSEDRYVITTQF